MQITDYMFEFERDYYPMWVPKYYQRARKRFSSWIPVRSYHKHTDNTQKSPNKTLFDYIPEYPLLKLPKAPYLRRFHSLPRYSFNDFAVTHISKYEWDLIQLLPEFTGYFNHIFELNDLMFFDDLQEELEAKNKNFKDIFLFDIMQVIYRYKISKIYKINLFF